ncbi:MULTISPECIES: transcription elongation factor GreA [unclassified Paenibacillus]|uniref:transcription elongation factor GreA n=1 Tax=unclassified Paenibacillus TaxID=185978 RepID=UPI000956A1C4|nr:MULTISPECIES: transcription elongation factor GreA [unclassified Paenibacillus]ASS67476.1 transcription elongation factor GreA [Paenibacillus sp. RUD330]SIQ75670.1 transcription elongation factor GreA [Paenibacillus sp. RU4X]SIQ97117.1 transcription elongation factor GreA [Paenibacillus sp. RU4T]
MDNHEIILTAEGLAKLEAELEDLKGPRRRELAQRIKTAISYGDLKENSEYHSAKDDQAFMETRILQLQAMLKKARVATTTDTSSINVGSVVVLHDREFDENVEYRIVSPAEADVLESRISYESPLGKNLIRKRVGDVVEVDAPMGKISYKVLEIKTV